MKKRKETPSCFVLKRHTALLLNMLILISVLSSEQLSAQVSNDIGTTSPNFSINTTFSDLTSSLFLHGSTNQGNRSWQLLRDGITGDFRIRVRPLNQDRLIIRTDGSVDINGPLNIPELKLSGGLPVSHRTNSGGQVFQTVMNWWGQNPDLTTGGLHYAMDTRANLAYRNFAWFYRRPNAASQGDFQMNMALDADGVLRTRGLTVNQNTMDAASQLPEGAIAHFDGRVYISEDGGTEEGFDNLGDANYQDYLLWVEEGIVSNDFAIAEATDWPDYVFEEEYDLSSLEEVESHIIENGHLHTMPSAAEIEGHGYTLGDINKRMVKTIEELTLHTIDQEKQIDTQSVLIQELMMRLTRLEGKVQK